MNLNALRSGKQERSSISDRLPTLSHREPLPAQEPKSTMNAQVRMPEGTFMSNKFIIEINVYPNGSVYPSIYPIGQVLRKMKEKNTPKKKAAKIEVAKEEVY